MQLGCRKFRAAMTVAVVTTLLTLGLTACEGVAYDGPYNADFRGDLDSYAGEEVLLSGDVNEVVSPGAFTITGTEGEDVEPLLVIAQQGAMVEINAGMTVDVTGLVGQAFDLQAVEQELGIELDDEELQEWDSEAYLQATDIDGSIDRDG